MKSFAVVALFALLACANAQIFSSGKILQGPSSRATVVGPDGSAIHSVAPGGSVVAEHHSGVVAHTAPIVAHAPVVAHTAYAAPAVVAHHAPLAYAHHGLYAHHGYYF
ncbi:cuticle protein 21-like [Tribolium madens]|uniref:cuticle protein 21-like n=1 Tax=Tribolium madens TaxID=41895 RepID=UPI001CF74DDC|nr:cuticle protein 21-like [Tribolium madens]